MSETRFGALKDALDREQVKVAPVGKRIKDYFGANVFGDRSMQEHLSKKAYRAVRDVVEQGGKLDRELADQVAEAMRTWATERGATHYAHWFQPLTGRTAEKHDSFFTLGHDGSLIEEFDGEALAQQEPDGSSFPGGGLRTTFEARGYTAWDPSSPAFILEVGEGKTLCIPTIFVTYGGEALDYKLPLLKSQAFLEEAAIPVCQWFDPKVTRVTATLGWEQEYFLIDEALFYARPDVLLTGRTLLGKYAVKGQQLDDHYFGSIPERVYQYMRDLEQECHKLGIPVRTRHNEVAPGQYELAPMYEEVNVAVDHNQLLMDLMERIALRHKLRVLFHEKPFAGVNGSGKHNNWSMGTNTGKNLLSPGKQPGKNLRFLTFFMNTIQAVHKHADLIRASVASASNDHRLGANEAPPAIISVFVGRTLSQVLDEIEKGVDDGIDGVKRALDLLSKIPNLELDNTDRNRTSPFAFTGNKFEIRMAGSTVNCAAPMTVMNTIVGAQLKIFYGEVQALINTGKSQDEAILTVIRQYITASKAIRFEGDNYSDEWKDEAASRGLNNFPTTPEALDAYVSDQTRALFTSSGIFSEAEIDAHHEVRLENYIIQLQIESRTLGEMCWNQVIPVAVRYQTELATNILKLKKVGLDKAAYQAQKDILQRISENLNAVRALLEDMREARMAANTLDTRESALTYCREVRPLMDQIRVHADRLELLVDDAQWPLAKYREMMFIR